MVDGNVIFIGDCLTLLPRMGYSSVQLTFTSPPYYNARAYAQYPSYADYLAFLDRVFREVHRVTAEGRFLIVNSSPVLEPREQRQDKSTRFGIPFDIHHLLVSNGWDFEEDIVWQKPEGCASNRVSIFNRFRKPLSYRPNAIVEYIMVYRKHTDKLIDWNMKQYPDATIDASKVLGKFFRTNVWNICPTSDDVHTAVFPEPLCREVIRLYSYKGDRILDPFAGSGTVGRVAMTLERYFTMMEQQSEYIQRMKVLYSQPEYTSSSLIQTSYQKRVKFL